MVKHHLMIGTWTPPGVIITVSFDTETLKLKLVKKTEIPEDEPISWMAFDVPSPRPPPQSSSMADHGRYSTNGRTSTAPL
jgi:hypothetical protein